MNYHTHTLRAQRRRREAGQWLRLLAGFGVVLSLLAVFHAVIADQAGAWQTNIQTDEDCDGWYLRFTNTENPGRGRSMDVTVESTTFTVAPQASHTVTPDADRVTVTATWTDGRRGVDRWVVSRPGHDYDCSPPTTTTTEAPPTTTTTTTPPWVCEEDMACWDCETMGNTVCGPTTTITLPPPTTTEVPPPACAFPFTPAEPCPFDEDIPPSAPIPDPTPIPRTPDFTG